MRFLLSQNTESSLQKADEILSKTNSDSQELLVLRGNSGEIEQIQNGEARFENIFREREKQESQSILRSSTLCDCMYRVQSFESSSKSKEN